MRTLERRMRVQNEKIRLLKAGGADQYDIMEVRTRREATYQEYKNFAEKMGLPEQMNRVFNSEIKTAKQTTYTLPATYEDRTQEYIDNAKGHIGTITKDDGYIDIQQHVMEEQSAYWASKTFGVDVHLLKEPDEKGALRADSIFNSEKVFEFKNASSLKSIQNGINHAIPQIKQTVDALDGVRPGGVVLNIVNASLSNSSVINTVINKMKHYKKGSNLDIIIRRGDEIVIVIRSEARK
jgi:hypothetical protein